MLIYIEEVNPPPPPRSLKLSLYVGV